MEEATALNIGREWLRKTRKSEERLGLLADTLQRVVPEPETCAWTSDNHRLMLLADKKQLWIATLEFEPKDQFDGMTRVRVEHVDLSAEPPLLSLTETHTLESDRPRITYGWRLELDRIPEPLEFGATEPHAVGLESHDPAVAFGWRLAEATGWTKPK
jgi:hypothetical protein